MPGDEFVRELATRESSFLAIKWIALAKGFLKCLDTENIRDPDHPRTGADGTRSVFKGDNHRPTSERVTSLTNIHEFTLALGRHAHDGRRTSTYSPALFS